MGVIGVMAVLALALPVAVSADAFALMSPAYHNGDMLPQEASYTGGDQAAIPCGGRNTSPPLSWSGAPAATKSFALTFIDIDGSKGAGTTHWLLYNIPPAITSLPERAGKSKHTPYTYGRNVLGRPIYIGPCPPVADPPHHYVFTLYALNVAPTLAPNLDRNALTAAIKAHIIGKATLTGLAKRSAPGT